MKRVKKPKSNARISLTAKQIEKLKRDIADEATRKACLLFLVGMADELHITGEGCERVMIRVDRYARSLDDHLVRMKDVSESLLKNTGIDIRWTK